MSTGRAVGHIVCLPPAGAGASFYRGWLAMLPESVELVAAQLPGRENRIRERPPPSIGVMASEVVCALRSYLQAPTVVFGHSMGALLAFEVSRGLAGHQLAPRAVVVSGCRPPHLLHRDEQMSQFGDEQLLRRLGELGGTADTVLHSRELLELILPTLRSDLAAVDSYKVSPDSALPCPLVALGGADDPGITEADLQAWRGCTTGPFAHRLFAGGHFYLLEHASAVVRLVLKRLLYR